jgi:hypothetical protein
MRQRRAADNAAKIWRCVGGPDGTKTSSFRQGFIPRISGPMSRGWGGRSKEPEEGGDLHSMSRHVALTEVRVSSFRLTVRPFS